MKISVIVPNFNGARFLEACLLSILDNCKNDHRDHGGTEERPEAFSYELELIVVDGGSTDASVEIIKKYEDRLAYWVSEPDEGHYDAVNKGMAKATGDVLCWLNSDDMLAPGALQTVADIFKQFPAVDWLTGRPSFWGEDGKMTETAPCRAYSRACLRRGEHDSRILQGVQQESCFWRRELWEKVGGKVDTAYSLAGDFDLWTRFAEHADLVAVDGVLSGNRQHPEQRSRLQHEEYFEQVDRISQERGARSWLRSRPMRALRSVRGGWRVYTALCGAGRGAVARKHRLLSV